MLDPEYSGADKESDWRGKRKKKHKYKHNELQKSPMFSWMKKAFEKKQGFKVPGSLVKYELWMAYSQGNFQKPSVVQ